MEGNGKGRKEENANAYVYKLLILYNLELFIVKCCVVCKKDSSWPLLRSIYPFALLVGGDADGNTNRWVGSCI